MDKIFFFLTFFGPKLSSSGGRSIVSKNIFYISLYNSIVSFGDLLNRLMQLELLKEISKTE
jgi:hypothetical protein